MRKLLFIAFTLLIAFASTDLAQAQKFAGLDASPLDQVLYPRRGAEPLVRVVYSRPYKKGRTTFGGELAPFGKVWRTGANEATTVSLMKDASVAGKALPAGTYSVFTIPQEGKWTIIFNKSAYQWGNYQYKEADDVLRVEVETKKTAEALENFSITLEKAGEEVHMFMGWDDTYVAVPFKF